MDPAVVAKGNKTQLSYRQRVVVLLIAAGLKQCDAARMMGVRPAQVTRWKRLPAFAAFLAEKLEEAENKVEGVRKILLEGAPMAALKIMDLLDSEDEGIQIRASGDLLDRVGVSKTARLEAEVSGVLTLRDLVTKASQRDPAGKDDGESE